LSKIISRFSSAPTVFIGDRHEATQLELEAERTLTKFFPVVSFVTSPDGAKLIPIQEVHKFRQLLEEKCREAEQKGVQDGHAKGLHEGQAQARKVVADLQTAIRDIVGRREALLEEARQHVLDLVIRVARKVTFDAVEIDPDITVKMITRVIDQLVDRSNLVIKVNPDFLPIMEQHIEHFLEGSTSIKDIRFEADPRVRHGGCFIETPSGDIDARLESQFEVVEETMLENDDES
jgi:flagellar biosynthesis/type III secretory pathway protein FliH